MKSIVKRTMTLILLFVLISVTPVRAQTLIGDESAEAFGKTAVTAYVEMEEDTENSDKIKTGDESMAGTYIVLLLTSMTVIVANGIRACRQEE